MTFIKLLLLLLSANLLVIDCLEDCPPEQVHLALGVNESDYVLTWVTFMNAKSIVKYGINEPLDKIAQNDNEPDVFIDSGPLHRRLYMHRVTLPNLQPKTIYKYVVGSECGWSDILTLTTIPIGTNWKPRIYVYGDMGLYNARTLPFLKEEVKNQSIDVICHIGDFAYNLFTDNTYYGDRFMRLIEPIASAVPYMTCPGNHEYPDDFANYKSRFTMPGGDGQGQYYSFNVGQAHMIMFNHEFYYFGTENGTGRIEKQYNWLKQDLEIANLPKNRQARPWIIAMGHRPMLCSDLIDKEHCLYPERNLARVGFPVETPEGRKYVFGLEELFYNYGVELTFGAHEHNYERHWPAYNLKVCKGTESATNPYYNPPAPVHIVTGAAGNRESESPFLPYKKPWTAFRTRDYGYTRLYIHNATHLSFEQMSIDHGLAVIDTMVLVMEKHGAGIFNCT